MRSLILIVALLLAGTAHATTRTAVIVGGTVVNVVLLEDGATWSAPAGATMIASSVASIGDAYAGGIFTPATPATVTPAEMLQQKLAAGLAITSTGTPSLSGTYSLRASSLNDISQVITLINNASRFPAGQPAMVWLDMSGAPHVFTTTASFTAFAIAVGDYVAALRFTTNALELGVPADWPEATATIP